MASKQNRTETLRRHTLECMEIIGRYRPLSELMPEVDMLMSYVETDAERLALVKIAAHRANDARSMVSACREMEQALNERLKTPVAKTRHDA